MSTMPPSERDTKPNPDPTVATNKAVERAVKAERDYVDGQIAILEERLRAIDVATKLLNETVTRVPTDVEKEVTHLRELSDTRLAGIEQRFDERDIRFRIAAEDNRVAVNAALAAQKEAAAKQDESNTKAIDKSEVATAEKIDKLAELLQSKTDALTGKIEDNKERISRIESVRQGGIDTRQEQREGMTSMQQFAGTVIAVILVILALLAYQSRNNDQPATPVVTVTTTP